MDLQALKQNIDWDDHWMIDVAVEILNKLNIKCTPTNVVTVFQLIKDRHSAEDCRVVDYDSGWDRD